MTPKEFLRAIWPRDGIFCLATPYTPPGTKKTVFTHKTFTDVDAAAQYADNNKEKYDLFFAVHTLKAEKVWNPEKENFKTGELGGWEIRKQTNMKGARAFFFDLDVEQNNDRKYATQEEAARDLKRFCKAASLPQPLVTSSGGGLHVYWIVEDEIDAQDWKNYAIKLRQVARHHELKFDPARTTDVSSVLRVAGTFNLKKGLKRPVLALTPATTFENKKFLKLLDDATIRAGVTVSTAPNFFADVGGNLSEEFTGPAPSMKALMTACRQVREVAVLGGNVSEPRWYNVLNAVRFVENPEKYIHKVSEKHPAYDHDETEAKVAQLRSKGIKPVSCLKLAEVGGEELCEGCRFAGRVKSPVVAARLKDPAPAPQVQTVLGLNTVTVTIPPPPKPYARLKDGRLAMTAKNKEGDEMEVVIYDHDLYPMRRLVNDISETEQQVWCHVPSRGPKREFKLDADALYDRRKFVAAISHQGIYPKTANLQNLQDYMIAYISELQRLADADAQCNHLGWTDDKAKFILPDKILHTDGSVTPASLSLGAQRSSAQVHKKGTLQRQVELLEFYNHPDYVANQFIIMQSLGAAFMYATGHHGVIINATGEPGASKSTTLYTAASLWGQPELYPINGTNSGATVRGRNERITTLANLPICVDEITNIPQREAVDLAMSITQPGHRIRLNTDGVERNSTGSYKATIMLTTANNSLHSLLSTENAAGTAGSMRVLEVQFKRTTVHTKPQADDFLHDLKENYGHIGEAVLALAIKHQKEVENLIREEMRRIDVDATIEPGERFWSTPAAGFALARFAKKHGLMPYDVDFVRDWFVTKQIPYMRGIVVEEYATPAGALADYLEHINNNIIVMSKATGAFGGDLVSRPPHGELLARYEKDDSTMWVALKPFKDWCVRQGLNHRKIIEELAQSRAITSTNLKKVLGAGSEFAKAQSRVFIVNMGHPDISDAATIKNDNVVPLRKA